MPNRSDSGHPARSLVPAAARIMRACSLGGGCSRAVTISDHVQPLSTARPPISANGRAPCLDLSRAERLSLAGDIHADQVTRHGLRRSGAVNKQFKGTINVDIRDSVPDWAPFEPPKAPDGAPNVVYIVLDDVGLLGDELLRRADRDAEHRPDRGRRGALHAVAHHGAVLADPLVPADRAQPHPQQHGLHHRGGDRVPERQRHDPAGERHALRDPRRARLEHLHGRQVAPVPDRSR